MTKECHGSIGLKANQSIYTRTVFMISLLVLLCALHIMIGEVEVGFKDVFSAIFSFNPDDFIHQVILKTRLPRLSIAIAVGMSLGVCGVLLQSIIRNPLADPQILGLNAGASMAVVVVSVFGLPSWVGNVDNLRPWIAAGGAFLSFSVVLLLSTAGRYGSTPLKVTLCGIAVSAFLGALTSLILLLDERSLEELRVWLSGDFAGRSFSELRVVVPIMVLGVGAAIYYAPKLNALSLGNDMARVLGLHVNYIRIGTLLTAALLAGAAVTVAGPIGFVGLIVPHIVRRFIGSNLQYVIPFSALGGALLLILADLVGRIIIAPQDLPSGIVIAAIGAPIYIVIVARYFR